MVHLCRRPPHAHQPRHPQRLSPLLERDGRRIELMNGCCSPCPDAGDLLRRRDRHRRLHLPRAATGSHADAVIDRPRWQLLRADPARLVLRRSRTRWTAPGGRRRGAARSRSSLLDSMRRMLAVRRRAFGRATGLLSPPTAGPCLSTRARGRHDPLVFNLSARHRRSSWTFPTTPARFHSKCCGGTSFPAVGHLPCLLTCRYGSIGYAGRSRAMRNWHDTAPEPLPSAPW